MTLNFNFQFKDLAEKKMQGENSSSGKVLAQMIANLNKGNSVKLYDWSLKLYNLKSLEIDDTDFDVLWELIDKTETLTIAAKGQLLEYLKSVKDKENKDKENKKK